MNVHNDGPMIVITVAITIFYSYNLFKKNTPFLIATGLILVKKT